MTALRDSTGSTGAGTTIPGPWPCWIGFWCRDWHPVRGYSTSAVARALSHVFVSLRPAGAFAFDVNIEESYRTGWENTCTVVESDNAFFVRGGYDPEQRLGHTEITMFRLDGQWCRADATILQRCYSEEGLRKLFAEAGFRSVTCYDVPRDLDSRPSRRAARR